MGIHGERSIIALQFQFSPDEISLAAVNAQQVQHLFLLAVNHQN
jgi:hypothetical protein